MRRSALAIGLIPLYAANVFAQSQVQRVATPAPEDSGANGPVPGGTDPSHPPSANPAGPLTVVREDKEPPPPLRPAAPDRDQVAGHLRLALGAAFGNLTGNFLDESGIGKRLGGSPLFLADLGIGFSRQLELVLSADYSSALAGARCSSCEATSWSLGPMLRYHVVQGTRFSPWLAIGGAYRQNALVGFSSANVKSIDFLKLQLGGDWYATSNVAFGPVLSCAISSSISVPDDEGAAVFSLVYAGLRLVFDLPGR